MKKWEIQTERIANSEWQIDDLIEILLKNRGIKNEEEVEKFLHPKLEDVTPEVVGINKKQLVKAMKRIFQAIEKEEQIIVFGDYDVDGITGSAILWESLKALGANVMPYIPHRIDEGYGLSVKGIENVLVKYPQTQLIISVDNGIMAHEAVSYANEKGLEVIITDHHTPEEKEKGDPKAYAVVHTTKLCGAGVAYVLTREMRKSLKNGKKRDFSPLAQSDNREIATSSPSSRNDRDLDEEHLELATLGTVADLVPLTASNRTIVYHGLKKLCQTKRPGLLAMFQEAACDKSVLGVYEIGHIIAPRLNAAGRLESAMDSLRLLCTRDTQRAHDLALQLGRTNTDRQGLMKDTIAHAMKTLKDEQREQRKILFIGHATYPPGVIGLVAGRLVEEFYRPAIVLSVGEQYAKASVRSVSGFNIIDFLRKHKELFVNLGGHPMAAGFTIETTNLETLQKALEDMGEEVLTEDILTRRLKIDCEVPLKMVTKKLYDALQELAPFGMSNPEPTFVSRNVEVVNVKPLGREGKHLRLIVRQDTSPILEAVAFGFGELAVTLNIGDTIDLAYIVDENVWNGNRKLQLKVKDIQISS